MTSAIEIGVKKDAVKEARLAIMAILNCQSCDQSKIEAIKTLATLCSANGATISNCTFQTGQANKPFRKKWHWEHK